MKVKLKKKQTSTKVVQTGAQHLPNGDFAPGHEKVGGREKGTPNKFTSLKHSFIEVFKRRGGDDGLEAFANLNPKEFYRYIASMLPREVNIGSTEEVQPGNLTAVTDEELDAIVQGRKRRNSEGESGAGSKTPA